MGCKDSTNKMPTSIAWLVASFHATVFGCMAKDYGISIVTAAELTVQYNELKVLDRASLAIHEGSRIGLVGRNGSGKSTFLKILANVMEADSGTITRKRDLITGYLPQEFSLDPALTVYENIREGARYVLDWIHEFESLPAESHRHSDLEQRITTHEGWNLEQRIETAMSHLHTPAGDRSIKNLSGGELRRVVMARTIVARPDFMILDEPTNHLDPESVAWLEEFLSDFPGTFLLVTHDRHFLDSVCDGIVELANGVFYSYDGNYSRYLEAKSERLATEELTEHKRQSFLKRELEWVRRGPKAQTTKSKARWDRYDAINDKQAPVIEGEVDLILPPPPPLGNRIVDLTHVAAGVGDRILFRQFDFVFEAGMRIGVTGRNGVGKTTLLKTILNQLEPKEGSVKIGSLTKFNYVDQSRLQLNEERTVLQEVADGSEFVMWGNGKISLRAYLKRFLFTDDRISTRVKHLSGGERSRLLLARVLKNGGNFLILDEPTNDLDLNTLRILEEALEAFAGVVLVVSHDRYFLDRVCNGILAFEDNERITYSVGNYTYYTEKKKEREGLARSEATKKTGPKPGTQPKPVKSKLSWKDARELEGMEAAILVVELEIARVETIFADANFHKTQGPQAEELTKHLHQQQGFLATLFRRWEELEKLQSASAL